MELDANTLGELLRKERASSSLQEVEKSFYKDLKSLLNEIEEKHPPYSREGENLRNLVADIFNAREKKLVLFSLSYARSGEEIDLEYLTAEEEAFIKKIIGIIKDRRNSLLKSGEKKGEKKQKTNMADTTTRTEKKVETPGLLTLRMLQDLPHIVGVDGKTYGSFKAEDIVILPESNAKIFIKHGYGELIDSK